MPIFEYECGKCRRVSNFLVRSIKDHKRPACPKCGAASMSRAISRFAAVSGSKRGAGGGEPGEGAPGGGGPDGGPDLSMLEGLDENDPRSMGRVMRKMAAEAGEPMPPEMDEMCRRLEAGEDPEKIEESMGDLMAGDEGGAGPGGGSDDQLYEG